VTIERLLQKRPTDRFMYAADVSAVLAQCTIVGQPEPVVAPELPPAAPLPPAPPRAAAPVSDEEEEIHFTLQVSHFGTLAESAPAAPTVGLQAEPALSPAKAPEPPPLPDPIAALFARAWQEPTETLPLMLSEPSRSVLALREPPLVGRLGELARIKTLAAAACRKHQEERAAEAKMVRLAEAPALCRKNFDAFLLHHIQYNISAKITVLL
jgi:hypothetical protein